MKFKVKSKITELEDFQKKITNKKLKKKKNFKNLKEGIKKISNFIKQKNLKN